MSLPLHSMSLPLPSIPSADSSLSHLVTRGLLWTAQQSPDTHYTFDESTSAQSVISFGIPEIDGALPHRGIQREAIHELFYNDPLQPFSFPSCIPALLSHNAHRAVTTHNSWDGETLPLHTVWIGKQCWPTPSTFSLLAAESSPSSSLIDSSLFIDPPDDKLTLWALETALRSPSIHLVVAACPRVSLVTTKRLSLAAQNNGTTALLLRNIRDIAAPSCAATRWLITPTPSPYETPLWDLSLNKIKGNATPSSAWLVGIYEEDSNVSLRVFPRVVDRGHEEEAACKKYGT